MFPIRKAGVNVWTEEQIREFMEEIPTDDSDSGDECSLDFDSDDDVADPNFSVHLEEEDDDHEMAEQQPEGRTTASTSAEYVPPPSYTRRKRQASPDMVAEDDGPTTVSTGVFFGTPETITNDARELKSLVWKKKNLQVHVNELIFRGDKEMPEYISNLKTPYECFKYFVNDELVQCIVDQTNLYAHQKDVNTNFNVTATDLQKFVGILFYMSVFRYPNVRSYWGKHAFEDIRQAMTVNRFEQIRRFLHYSDNSKAADRGFPGYDRLYRVRNLIDHFNNKFSSIPMLQRLCVDEQMCATKMTKTCLRQYMPKKPHKWGFKFFTLCDSNGFSYAFEIYTGAGDNTVPAGAPNLGASSNIVVRLTQKVPNCVNHVIYFDNFYTSLGLLVYLRSRGIHGLGTVRVNRVPNCKLSSDETLAKRKVKRGYSEEYVTNTFGVDITSVLWHDTKIVRLLSTYVGVKSFLSRHQRPPRKIIRWDKKENQHTEIDCPEIIKEYNRHMGGVDLMDGLLGRYHIRMKTTKWPNRIFYHLIDLAMVNSYILYHRIHPEKKKIDLANFREQVAEGLCKCGLSEGTRRVGRPSHSRSITPPPKPKRQYIPSENVRLDLTGHWCIFQDRSGKKMCKFPKCKSETQAFCVKCKVNLCNSTKKSCFYNFHNEKKI